MSKKLTVLLSVLLCSALLNGCANVSQQLKQFVSPPKVTFKQAALGKISHDSIELRPTFNISNGNAFDLPIDKITYQLSFNQQQVLDGFTDDIGRISAQQSKDITLGINLSHQVLKTLKNSLLNTKKLDYAVQGQVQVMGFNIPFQHAATLYVPQVKLNSIKVVSASLSQVKLMLDLNIDNKNDFKLPLDNISYSVASGGSTLFSGTLAQQYISHGKNNIQVPLTIASSKLFKNLFSLLRNPTIPLTIAVDSPMFSFSETQNINLKSLL